jgi:hypothetical protein
MGHSCATRPWHTHATPQLREGAHSRARTCSVDSSAFVQGLGPVAASGSGGAQLSADLNESDSSWSTRLARPRATSRSLISCVCVVGGGDNSLVGWEVAMHSWQRGAVPQGCCPHATAFMLTSSIAGPAAQPWPALHTCTDLSACCTLLLVMPDASTALRLRALLGLPPAAAAAAAAACPSDGCACGRGDAAAGRSGAAWRQARSKQQQCGVAIVHATHAQRCPHTAANTHTHTHTPCASRHPRHPRAPLRG